MFCTYCGLKTDPNIPKCVHCGAGHENVPKKICEKCGFHNNYKSSFCSGCGINFAEEEKKKDAETVKCPKCGSKEYVIGKKGFSVFKACLGILLAGPFGLLCGAHKANKVKLTCLKCRNRW
jgi:tellurium resistance protein TerD